MMDSVEEDLLPMPASFQSITKRQPFLVSEVGHTLFGLEKVRLHSRELKSSQDESVEERKVKKRENRRLVESSLSKALRLGLRPKRSKWDNDGLCRANSVARRRIVRSHPSQPHPEPCTATVAADIFSFSFWKEPKSR
ncbi:hypothetical protein EYF80_025322 [Liparis tanakae]|uniref:Uncharacterized protein n=1 Tax=Liparis tanakae TaxID=230148 RepID=A0A4Z2HFV0_9TELE|nr:hypothetical protein EYF80_025322 [Liparis tanakae]